MKGTNVTYKGEVYSSIRKLCQAMKVNYPMVVQRLNLGWTVEDAVDVPLKSHRNGVKIEYDGIEYPSLRNLAIEKGMPYHVVQMRVKNGMSIKDAVEIPVGGLMGNKTTFEGKTYPSFTSLCDEFDISVSIVLSRLGMGWSLEKALKTPIRRTKNRYIPELIYNGKTYPSLRKLCLEVGVDYQNTLNRLHRGKSLQEAIDTPKRYMKPRNKNN